MIFFRLPTARQFLGCLLALVLVGCAKKNQATAPPESTPQTALNNSPAVQGQPVPRNTTSTAVTQPAALNRVPVQPVVVDTGGDSASVLAQLTQALRKFSFENKRVPKSFSEVMGAGYVSEMPKAPPGKQFAVDVKRVEVVLVKQ